MKGREIPGEIRTSFRLELESFVGSREKFLEKGLNAFERVLFRLLEEILHSSRSIVTFIYQWHALTDVAYVIQYESINLENIFQFFFFFIIYNEEGI